jgi:tetratricopeptide (TPR) repeat protein
MGKYSLAVIILGLLNFLSAQASPPEQTLQSAITLYQHGKYQEAAEELEKLLYPLRIKNISKIAQAHLYLGLSYAMLDQPEKAQEEFHEALKLDPKLSLDPDYFLPEVISLFERVKSELIPREEVEKPLLPQLPKDGREKRVLLLTKERLLLNFLPGGVPQFQNGAKLKGWIVLTVQTSSLLTTAISYFLLNNYRDKKYGGVPKEGYEKKANEILLWMQASFWIGVSSYLYSVIDGILF